MQGFCALYQVRRIANLDHFALCRCEDYLFRNESMGGMAHKDKSFSQRVGNPESGVCTEGVCA